LSLLRIPSVLLPKGFYPFGESSCGLLISYIGFLKQYNEG
jgi:hypothetical protein